MVIGAEALSRVIDMHDRDSMIYSDGAGAAIIEASQDHTKGILAHHSATFAYDEAHFIYFGESYNQDLNDARRYIKMYGRKIYEFAITNVPAALKTCLEKTDVSIDDVSKVLIHQANEKMDEAIIKRFYKLFNKVSPEGVMPMTIDKLGNSSVATVPTLLDVILKRKLNEHEINEGDTIIFASVGAGMNINAIVYRFLIMYKHYPKKRYKYTLHFLKELVSKEDAILDLGVSNPFSELLQKKGYQVTNTQGEDLDLDTSAVRQSGYDVVTAFEIFEHLVSPFNVLHDIQAKKLIASVPLKLWFASAYRSKSDERDRHFHEFEDWQFDWLLEKSGWTIKKREKFTNPVKKVGIRPILRRFTPRYYLIYAERT